jgi:hypothetical protein
MKKSDDIESLLARAREALEPPLGAEARTLDAILRQTELPVARPPLVRNALVAAGGVAVTATLVWFLGRGAPSPSQVPEPTATTTIVAPPPSSDGRIAPPVLAVSALADAPVPSVHRKTVTAPSSALDAGAPLLPDDVTMLAEAKLALRRGDGTSALRRLDEHAAAYPSSALAQERTRLRVEALCALGRTTEAKQTFVRFQAETPNSPHLESLRRACPALSENE